MSRSERVAAGVAGALLVVGVGITVLSVVVPDAVAVLGDAIPADVFVRTAVLALGVLAVAFLRTSPSRPGHVEPLVPGPPPERSRRPPAVIGEAFDEAVTDAARAVRVQRVDPTETEPHGRLRETAVSVLAAVPGRSTTEAETRVENGEWTDDPVARAFLSPTGTYPTRFRLIRWARPALAYERAVSRTVAEIRSVALADVPGYTPETANTPDAGVTDTPPGARPLEAVRALVTGSGAVGRDRGSASTRSAVTPSTADGRTDAETVSGDAVEADAEGSTARHVPSAGVSSGSAADPGVTDTGSDSVSTGVSSDE